MKTAVSPPDERFEKVEGLARRVRLSRSEVYTAALRECVARHTADEVTKVMDRVCDVVDARLGEFAARASRGALGRTEW